MIRLWSLDKYVTDEDTKERSLESRKFVQEVKDEKDPKVTVARKIVLVDDASQQKVEVVLGLSEKLEDICVKLNDAFVSFQKALGK